MTSWNQAKPAKPIEANKIKNKFGVLETEENDPVAFSPATLEFIKTTNFRRFAYMTKGQMNRFLNTFHKLAFAGTDVSPVGKKFLRELMGKLEAKENEALKPAAEVISPLAALLTQMDVIEKLAPEHRTDAEAKLEYMWEELDENHRLALHPIQLIRLKKLLGVESSETQ